MRCRSEKSAEQSRIFARKMKISDISEEFWRKEPAKFSDFAVGGRKSDRLLAPRVAYGGPVGERRED